MKKFPVLWQHKTDEPIGYCQITDTPLGLQVNGTLELSDPTARKAYTFMKAGVIKGLSIGYDTVQATYDGDIRNLTELKLWEMSVVTFPMNELATVSSVKSLSDEDRAKHMKAINDHRKAIDRHQRGIFEHLKALVDLPDDDDDDRDNPTLEGDGDDGTKAFLLALQKLAKAATEFAAL